ncbi:MAG TPA: type II toxin-antitoxin system VapC family toxin [Thermoanaerobaculia bacterium]|nr:type II toxin-antitoxin system VapC family toxin [Thermoanaerobaculia bacterium]
MRFWDSSAIIPVALTEANSAAVRSLLRADRDCCIWWTSRTECLSGLHRRARAGGFDHEELTSAKRRVVLFDQSSDVVLPTEAVRSRAERLLAVHSLTAGDALQLAAALVAGEEDPTQLPFVTLDERLADAARKEGFPVVP